MQDHPLHNPVWALVLCDYMKSRGVDAAPLFMQAGLGPRASLSTESRVPFDALARFFELCAESLNDDLLGFEFGQTIDVRDAGLIVFMGVYAQTMHDAIVNTAAYSHVFGDAIRFDISDLDRTGRLGFDYLVPTSVETQQYVEWFASGCLRGYRSVLKTPITCTAVHFRHVRETGIPEMRRHFGCTPKFGQGENALYFTQSDLERTFPTSDSKLLTFLRKTAEDILQNSVSNAPRLQVDIENALARRLPGRAIRQADIARDLGLSSRTLSRRLAEEGMTFHDVTKGFREALATRYLTQSAIPQAEIAFLLGFADQASFVNAYRAWTGSTPGAARRAGHRNVVAGTSDHSASR